MSQWAVLAVYLAIGLLFVFAGPIARNRKRERVEREWDQLHTTWKSIIHFFSIALGVFVLWPLFLSRRRGEVQNWIRAIQKRHASSLPHDVYQQIMACLPQARRADFQKRLSELGYVVTGLVKDVEGTEIAIAVTSLSVTSPFTGIPLTLIQQLATDTASWPRASRMWHLGSADSHSLPPEIREWLTHSDDEIWEFSSDQRSWQNFTGRGGLARVRNRVVIETYVTVLS